MKIHNLLNEFVICLFNFLEVSNLETKLIQPWIVLYADGMTEPIRAVLEKTEKCRVMQMSYNQELGIVVQDHQEAHSGKGGGDYRHQAYPVVRYP